MEIESARALKAEISEFVTPLVEAGVINRAFGVAATSMERAEKPTRALALGIGRGRDPSGEKDDYSLAVRVQRRALEEDSALIDRIRETARGEVDIRYVGQIFKQAAPWHQLRQRPLLIGSSVAHHLVTAGTVGAFVRRKGDDRLYALSNNHVLANEDFARNGDAVLQPGPIDGGRNSADRIGVLHDCVRLKARHNLVDAAVTTIGNDTLVDLTTLTGLGILAGVATTPLLPGDAVSKIGRTTGLTRGVVSAIELDDLVIGYDRGALSFDRQIEIEGVGDQAFSAGGDSGSLVVNADLEGVGLLFAGGDQGGGNGKGNSYANDLKTVLSKLTVELAI